MTTDAPKLRPVRTQLERRLREQDRTYEESAAWFAQVALNLGERCTITARHLRRLASGQRSGTTPATRRALQAMFEQPAAELLAPSSPAEEVPEKAHPEPECQSLDAVGVPERQALRMAAARARQFTLQASASNLKGESMDQLHEDVARLAVAYQQGPPAQILPELIETQDVLFTLLEGRQPPAATRRLLLLAGVSSGILAKISHDLADAHTALTHSRTAYLCADNADHNGLRAWIRGLQSLIAYWAGRPHEAIRYAQKGAAFAGRSTASTWLPVSEARAWAALRNTATALELIERAVDARDTVEPDELDDLGGICTFTHARQLYYAADALAWLPEQAGRGEQQALEALEAYADSQAPGWCYSDAAGAATNLAIARLAGNNIEGAADALDTVLTLPTKQRINGVLASAQRVRASLPAARTSAAASTLHERIESFTALPAAVLAR